MKQQNLKNPAATAAIVFMSVSVLSIPTAVAQSTLPALFVTDHFSTSPEFGNFASIRSFTINVDGTLNPVGTYFTNDLPYELSLSPSGRFLAVGHASALADEDLIVFQVNADASLTMFAVVTVQSSPFEIAWLDDETLIVLETANGNSGIWTYDFDEAAPLPLKILPIDDARTGVFSSHFALHPNEPYLYVPDSPLSGTNRVRGFRIEPDRTLTEIQSLVVPPYALDIDITPDGRFMYMVLGAGTEAIQGFEIDPATGLMTTLPFGPFPTTGGPASHIVITPDGGTAFVFHGATETIQTFSISPDDGTLFFTNNSFGIGGNGIFESIQVYQNFLYVTRNAGSGIEAGILLFNYFLDGSFSQLGSSIPAGTRPYFMEVWNPQSFLVGDINGDGSVDPLDIPAFVAALLGTPIEPVHVSRSDINLDGDANGQDSQLFVTAILSPTMGGACCLPDLPCETVTQDECVNVLGGIYAGDGVPCAVCPPIPAPIISSTFGSGPPYCNDVFPIYQFAVFGENFSSGADVRLVQDGQPDIFPDVFQVFDEFSIGADFDFTGAATGSYQLRVTNPDGQFADSVEDFVIEACN